VNRHFMAFYPEFSSQLSAVLPISLQIFLSWYYRLA